MPSWGISISLVQTSTYLIWCSKLSANLMRSHAGVEESLSKKLQFSSVETQKVDLAVYRWFSAKERRHVELRMLHKAVRGRQRKCSSLVTQQLKSNLMSMRPCLKTKPLRIHWREWFSQQLKYTKRFLYVK